MKSAKTLTNAMLTRDALHVTGFRQAARSLLGAVGHVSNSMGLGSQTVTSSRQRPSSTSNSTHERIPTMSHLFRSPVRFTRDRGTTIMQMFSKLLVALLLAMLAIPGAPRVLHPIAVYANSCYPEPPFDTLMLAGSSWLGGNGVDVSSNGSTCTVSNTNDSVGGGMKWQCVELVNRLYLTRRWITSYWSGSGYQMYGNAPSYLSKQPQGSITNLAPGDVVSYSGGSSGHVAIVNSVTPNGSGGFTVATVNQNTPSAVYDTTLTAGTLSSPWTGYAVIGVIHAPGTLGPILPAVQGDYTGYRNTQIAVYRPGDGTWHIFNGTGNPATVYQAGWPGDIPVCWFR